MEFKYYIDGEGEEDAIELKAPYETDNILFLARIAAEDYYNRFGLEEMYDWIYDYLDFYIVVGNNKPQRVRIILEFTPTFDCCIAE